MNFKNGYDDINKLLVEIGLTARLSDFGYIESHLETIIKETLGSAQAATNPRTPIEEDLADIVRRII